MVDNGFDFHARRISICFCANIMVLQPFVYYFKYMPDGKNIWVIFWFIRVEMLHFSNMPRFSSDKIVSRLLIEKSPTTRKSCQDRWPARQRAGQPR